MKTFIIGSALLASSLLITPILVQPVVEPISVPHVVKPTFTPVITGGSVSKPVVQSKVAVSDVVVPKTEPEQDAQIDQNTIKNVEQDSRLDNLDTKTNDLQNQVNTPVITPPAPVPTPTPPPAPTPPPPPVVIPDPSLVFQGENRPDTEVIGLFVKSVTTPATIISFQYTLTNRDIGTEGYSEILVNRLGTSEYAFQGNLPVDYTNSAEYVLVNPLHTSLRDFTPLAEATVPSQMAGFHITEITYLVDGETSNRTIIVNN